MELVDRYLQAVKFWLPEKQKNDIAAELSEEIQAQVVEREAECGRTLTASEVEGILKQLGRPVLVANRYLPQRHLIGPVLFPIYRFVMKIVAIVVLAPTALVWLGMLIFSPSYRAAHPWPEAFGSLWASSWATAFVALGVVTIVFAVLERTQGKSHFLEDWNPADLPPLRNPAAISRTGASIELAVNLVVFIWWAANMSSPIVLNHPNLQITLAPLWSTFYWAFLVTTFVNIVAAGVNIARPYWTILRASFRLVTDCAGSVLFCWLLKSNILAGFTAAGVSAERAVVITNAINLWMEKMFPAGVLLCLVIAANGVYRIARLRMAKGGSAPEPTHLPFAHVR